MIAPKLSTIIRALLQDINWNGHSLGEGMGIVLINTSTSVVINNSIFTTENKASWGAGLCIYLKDSVQNITL